MKKSRSNEILEYLNVHKNATVNELCNVFHVSDMTIRRDLIKLESTHSITRFHGGAAINSNEAHADMFHKRMLINSDLKTKLGKACAEYAARQVRIGNCTSIFIASGSTLYEFAKQLDLPDSVTLITDNIYVSNALLNSGTSRIIMIGGQLLLSSANAVGFAAERMVSNFSTDIAFISTAALDENGTIYMFNPVESGMFNAIIESTRHVVLVADHTKLGKKNLVQLCTIDERFTLVTDSGAPAAMLDNYRKRGAEVIVI